MSLPRKSSASRHAALAPRVARSCRWTEGSYSRSERAFTKCGCCWRPPREPRRLGVEGPLGQLTSPLPSDWSAKSSNNGKRYLTGRLGGVKVLILENRERQGDNDRTHNLVEAPDKRRRELIRIDGGTQPRVRISGAFKRGKQVFYVATDDRV